MDMSGFLQGVYVALTFTDGVCRVMTFVTVGRGAGLPPGATWFKDDPSTGIWLRQPDFANIQQTIDQAHPKHDRDGNALATVASWRTMKPGEDPLKDARFMAARVDDGSKIGYDPVKLRECWRECLRRDRLAEFEKNDLALRDAMLVDDKVAIAAAVARRDELRDVTADPRIDAATTVEQLQAVTIAPAIDQVETTVSLVG